MKTQNHNESGFIQRNISKFIILIFILQPLMDMLSFFVEKIGSGYSITLLLRFGVLAVTAIVCFGRARIRLHETGVSAAR